jgi:hypothetical protein
MERGGLGIGEGGEVMEDGAETASGDLEGSAVWKIDEVGFVVGEFVELVDGVAIEEGDEDGEEVEAFVVEIDADGESEPTTGGGFEGGFQFLVREFVNLVAEVGIDLDGPALFGEHFGGFGAEPGPIHRGGREVGIGKPAAFDGEFGRLLFGEGEEEAVGGIGGEVGERELGEVFDGAELGGFVALGRGLSAGFDEGEFVWAVADDGAGDEPGVAVLHLESLEEELDDAGAGRFFGDFEVEGGLVSGAVFLNWFRGFFGSGRDRRGSTAPQEAGEGIGPGGAEEGGGGVGAK